MVEGGLSLAGGLQLLDHLEAAAGGRWPPQGTRCWGGNFAPEDSLAGQLAVPQALVDQHVNADIVRRDNEGVFEECKGPPGELKAGWGMVLPALYSNSI